MKVFIITEDDGEYGYNLLNVEKKVVWSTREGAEKEVQKRMENSPFAHIYSDFEIHEMEVEV